MKSEMNSDQLVTVSCDLCGAEPGEPFLEKYELFYTRCRHCDHIYANPRLANPAAYNEENNEEQLQRYVKKQYSTRHQQGYVRRVASYESYRKNNRILDLGCNVGGFVYQAKKHKWDAVGVEPVAAVANYGVREHDLDIRASTLEDAKFPDNHFDVVFSNAVLEHLPSPSEVISEVFRVLRPGGLFYADTVNFDSFTWANVGKNWKLVDPRAHLCLFTPKTLRDFCQRSGFVNIKLASSGVRFRTNEQPKLTGIFWLLEELKKGPYSLLARIRLKGDSIEVFAQKPE